MDRFTIIEMDLLSAYDEAELLSIMFPFSSRVRISRRSAGITEMTSLTKVTESKSDTARISSSEYHVLEPPLSYDCVAIRWLLVTGSVAGNRPICPQYTTDGGVDSERTFVKQIVQKFCDDGTEKDLFNIEDTTDGEEI